MRTLTTGALSALQRNPLPLALLSPGSLVRDMALAALAQAQRQLAGRLLGNVAQVNLIAEIERTHDPKVVSSTVSTMIRRGELKELANGNIALGSEEEIEKARQEREQRRERRPEGLVVTVRLVRDVRELV